MTRESQHAELEVDTDVKIFRRNFFVGIFSSEFFRRNFFVGIFSSKFFSSVVGPSSVRPSVRSSSVRPSGVDFTSNGKIISIGQKKSQLYRTAITYIIYLVQLPKHVISSISLLKTYVEVMTVAGELKSLARVITD